MYLLLKYQSGLDWIGHLYIIEFTITSLMKDTSMYTLSKLTEWYASAWVFWGGPYKWSEALASTDSFVAAQCRNIASAVFPLWPNLFHPFTLNFWGFWCNFGSPLGFWWKLVWLYYGHKIFFERMVHFELKNLIIILRRLLIEVSSDYKLDKYVKWVHWCLQFWTCCLN